MRTLDLRKCDECNTEFKPIKAIQKTCSRKCGQAYRTRLATQTCPICGDPFVGKGKRPKFCSGTCYGRYRSQSAEITEALRRRRDFFATKEEIEHQYHELQMSQEEIAAHHGVSLKKTWGLMQYYGITSRVAAKRHQNGALNHAWKGGNIRMGKYRYIRMPDHPNATLSGYLAEHIAVATKAAGRSLTENECVHHKDGDKENNDENNLFITTYSRHGKLHRELETIAFALYRAGLIEFSDGQYRVTDKLRELAEVTNK